MVDPYMVISELEETTIENVIEEKQIILHKSEFLEGQSEIVVYKPPDNGQVVDKFASSSKPEPDIQSMHEHKLELKNFDKRFICNGCKEDGLSLHLFSINLKSKLQIQGYTFSLKNKASSDCYWCDVKNEKGVNSGWSYVSECGNYQFHVECIAQMAHEAWKKKADEDVDDAYSVVLAESFIMCLVKKSKRNSWSRGRKFVKMITLIARTIISILLGDPTAIIAPIVSELLKN